MKNFGKKICCLLVFLLLTSFAIADEALKPGSQLITQGLELTLTHYEVARSQPVVFVHFEVRNSSTEPLTCDWRDLVYLIEADGNKRSSNYDALVDLGHGLTRTAGPFPLAAKRRAKLAVPFLLSDDSLPGVLELVDGRRSQTLKARSKAR